MLRSSAMKLFVVLVAFCVTLPAVAQDVPFMGVVTQDDTKIRAGAGRAYYVVGELDSGAIVQVDEVIFGWNKVIPPKGVYSYVSKAFVDAKGDAKTGFVNSDRVEVKAGSQKGPGESYRGQIVLNKGDTVEILESEANFYKVAPPKGAYVFLPPGSVTRATPQQIAAAQGGAPAADPEPVAVEPAPAPPTPEDTATAQAPVMTPADPAPTTEPAPTTGTEPAPMVATPANPTDTAPAPLQAQDPQPTTTTTDAGTTPPAPTATGEQPAAPTGTETVDQGKNAASYQTAAVSDKLKALEQQMIPLFFKPLEQQPVDDMIKQYEAIQREPLPAMDKQIVKMRLAALQKNKGLKETLSSIQAAQANPVQVQAIEAQPGAPLQYDAIGTLLASSVYNGLNLPRMFRVVDPATGRTIVWVEPTSQIDPKSYLGKVVGVIGKQEYDPALKFNVLDVQRIDVLEAQAAQVTP